MNVGVCFPLVTHGTQIGEIEKDIAIGGGALFNDGILRGSDLHFEANEAAVRRSTCTRARLRGLPCVRVLSLWVAFHAISHASTHQSNIALCHHFQRMGGAVLLARGSAILSRCTFVENAAGVRIGRILGIPAVRNFLKTLVCPLQVV